MLYLIIFLIIGFALLKGFFKLILPILLILFAIKLFFSGLLLIFSFHFWEIVLAIIFFGWLIKTVSRQNNRN